MSRFYRNAALIFLILAILTSLIIYVCLERAFVSDALLPARQSVIPWKFVTASDSDVGGSSRVSVNDSDYGLDFDLFFSKEAEDSFISATLLFDDAKPPKHFFDLTKYSKLSFNAKCVPPNVLSFVVLVFDEKVTDPGDSLSYRIPTTFFSCKESWTEIEIDLQHLTVPEWWLRLFNFDLSDLDYRLEKVAGLSFGVTSQSPVNITSNVKINGLVLHGRNWLYVYALYGVCIILWVGFIVWLFKQYEKYLIANIEEKLLKDRPLVAYQQLSIEPHKDQGKSTVMRFMATEYANPEMNLELAAAKLGLNRNKINTMLKEELGLTFTTYLNKLRLSEAARLLKHEEAANVADIAYTVGYNNVSYFNKLFKNEYGCTPKAFRNIYQERGPDD